MFTADVYKARRQALAQAVGSGQILLLGNEESPMNYQANVYPHFCQDSTFRYFIGLNLPGMHAIMDVDKGQTTLYGYDPTVEDMVWTGNQPRLAQLAEQVGISQSAPLGQLAADLGTEVHYLPPYRGIHTVQLAEYLGRSPQEIKAHPSPALIKAVIAQRAYKTSAEVQELEKALHITRQMHLTAMQVAEPGMVEAEVMAPVFEQVLAAQAWPSYPIILTVHGEILHNHHHHHTLVAGDLLLMDGGASAPSGYAGDITRTFPVAATFSTQQKEIYQLVLAAEKAVIEGLKPGIPYRDLHLLGAKLMTQGLIELGIMQGNAEEAVAAGAHALFFPHGMGHMIGMDVHDMENLGEDLVGYDEEIQRSNQFGLAALRLGRKLEAGFVLTVEPGLYFIPMLIDQWKAQGMHHTFINYDALEAYRTFGGIRIEDNLLITETGAQLIGDPIPKEIDEVEAIRQRVLASA